MRIGILIFSYPKSEGYAGAERILEAGRARGHDMVKLYEPYFTFSHDANGLRATHEGAPLGHFDVIIARPNFTEEPSLHTFTSDLLVQCGYRIVNHRPGSLKAKNKLTEHVRLAELKLPMPEWAIVHKTKDGLEAARHIGFPVIAKVGFGTHGVGVFHAADTETLAPILDYLAVRDGNPIILERFVSEAERKDLRVFVVGGMVIAAMERRAAPGDVRANAAQGRSGGPTTVTQPEADLAIAAAAAFDLEIAGVDIIRSANGPLILEVNANPGFAELESVTGIDVAGAIVEYATNP